MSQSLTQERSRIGTAITILLYLHLLCLIFFSFTFYIYYSLSNLLPKKKKKILRQILIQATTTIPNELLQQEQF